MTQVPLVRRYKFYLQGHTKEFADFLTDKVIQIHFQSDISVDTGPRKMPRVGPFPVIWKQFDPIAPEVVDRILGNVSSATCVLNQCPPWLVKSSGCVMC